MRTQNTLFRLSAAAAITGVVFGPAFGPLAQAQEAATATATAAASASAGDPPARVGRLASLSGTVSFHTAEEDHWEPATLNYPVTSGNAFWTEPQGAAAIEVGPTHLVLAEQTEFDLDTLDDHTLAATEPQGEIYVRLAEPLQGETYTVATPRGSVVLAGPGRFAIAAGDTEKPTTITVVEGSAQVTAPDLNVAIGAHQTATITGTDHFAGSVGAEADDPFLTAQLALERPPVEATTTATATATATVNYAPPPVVRQMTGADALETSGHWDEAPQYGHVWYPPVQRDWVPYRDGHWAYVAPWGWTWVDDAPWGFAPSHYGRWVQVDDRWAWTPVAEGAVYTEEPIAVAPPVYSPALVTFLGLGAAAAVGVVAGLALSGGFGGNVGWAPLGYREPYFPPYGVSQGYLGGINRYNVQRTTFNNINNNYSRIYNSRTVNNTVINNYYGTNGLANRSAATFVPAQAMVRSQPTQAHIVPVSARQLASVRPIATAPVIPTAQTLGATRAVLQHVNPVAARAAPSTPVRTAPGPAVTPPRTTPAVGQPARPGQPGLPGRPATGPAGVPGAAPAPVGPGQAGTASRPPLQPHAPVAPGVGATRPGAAGSGSPNPGAPGTGAAGLGAAGLGAAGLGAAGLGAAGLAASRPGATAASPVAPGTGAPGAGAPGAAPAAGGRNGLPPLRGQTAAQPGAVTRPGVAPGPAIAPRPAAPNVPPSTHPASPAAVGAGPASAGNSTPAPRPATPAGPPPNAGPRPNAGATTAAPGAQPPAPQRPAVPRPQPVGPATTPQAARPAAPTPPAARPAVSPPAPRPAPPPSVARPAPPPPAVRPAPPPVTRPTQAAPVAHPVPPPPPPRPAPPPPPPRPAPPPPPPPRPAPPPPPRPAPPPPPRPAPPPPPPRPAPPPPHKPCPPGHPAC